MLRSPLGCPASDTGDSGDRLVSSAMALLCLHQAGQGAEMQEVLWDHGPCQ